MRNLKFVLLLAVCLFIFPGCYWYETLIYRLDLTSKTGRIEFLDIVSLPDWFGKSIDSLYTPGEWTKEDIEKDWNHFITAFNKDSLYEKRAVTITSKELYGKGEKLNARFDFTFKDVADLNFTKSEDGTLYLMKKESGFLAETNGKTVMVDSIQYLAWSVNAKEIYLRFRLLKDDDKAYSLYPNYESWKKQQPD